MKFCHRMAVEQALVEGLLLWKSGRYYPKPSETAAAEPSTSKRVGGRRGSRVTMKGILRLKKMN